MSSIWAKHQLQHRHGKRKSISIIDFSSPKDLFTHYKNNLQSGSGYLGEKWFVTIAIAEGASRQKKKESGRQSSAERKTSSLNVHIIFLPRWLRNILIVICERPGRKKKRKALPCRWKTRSGKRRGTSLLSCRPARQIPLVHRTVQTPQK